MTEQGMQDKYKRDLKIARGRHGKQSEAQTNQRKEGLRLRKALLRALEGGPKTVPQLAAELSADARTVLWQIAALRKYNEVTDGSKQGDYIAYQRK